VIIAVIGKMDIVVNLMHPLEPTIGVLNGNHRRINMGYAPMKQPKPIKPPKRK
jgi:hypothetical protein